MDWRIILEEKFAPAFFAGITITLLSFLFKFTIQNAIIFASFGASAFILAGFPDTRAAKLKVVLFSYIFGGVLGYACSFMSSTAIAGGCAVFLTSLVMLLTDNDHPPSAGISLAFALEMKSITHLAQLIVLIILLLFIIKFIVYIYKKELHIRKFHHEFLR